MQQTPIELVIEKLRILNNDQWSPKLTETIKDIRENAIPYEKQYLRDVAEKALDAAEKYTFENVSIEHDYVRDMDFIELDYSSIEKDKQTYLNQNHPL